MALTASQRRQRQQQIERAQNDIRAGDFERAQIEINALIGGAGVGQAQAQLQGALNQARAAAATPAPPPPSDDTDTDPGGGGGGGYTGPSAEDIAAAQERIQAAAEKQRRDREAKAFLRDLFSQYGGMDALVAQIDQLVRDFGNSPDVLVGKIRQTQTYQDRFKGLIGLQRRGITDIRNEGEYLNLETQYRTVFREAGLTNYLGTSGTQNEYDAIASLVSDFSLSVNEVRDRITDAQRVVADTPQEVRDSLQQFYGIDPAMLTQYVLDPENTTTQIQRRANAAIVGGFAQRAGLTFGADVSERIGEFVGGGEDIRGTAIEPILTEVSDIQKATRRLADIDKTTLTEEETALSRLDLDQEAREKVRTLQSRERARFGGRSGIRSSALRRPRSI